MTEIADVAEVAAGIHRITLPTPFAVGPVNCYLLTGEPLTLVDVGPNHGTALDLLEQSLAERGVRVEDLELIVLTHQHVDHEGLAGVLMRRAAGAQLAAFGPLAPWLADHHEAVAADTAFAVTQLLRHGVDEELVAVLAANRAGLEGYGSSATVTRPLADGDTVVLGGHVWQVHHRPGHSPSDLVFLDPASGVLIGGDHLLAHISSNALVTRPLGAGAEAARPQPLLAYARSLRATAELPVKLVLGGHGEAITDHAALVGQRLRDQQRRARKIHKLLEAGPRSAHAIAREMWGHVALTQTYLTLSEVLGHLDILLEQGTVIEIETDQRSVFELA